MSLELAMTLAKAAGNIDELPDGWLYIGSGVSRRVFKGPDGNVYKYGTEQCNRSEVEAAAWFKQKFGPIPGIFIPDFIHYEATVSCFNSVSETVYLPADPEQDWHDSRRRWFLRKLIRCGLTDSHGGNIYTYKGLMTCVDWGFTDFYYGGISDDEE
jgi:hypothetical protein